MNTIFVNTLIPPNPHRLGGHKLFNFVAEQDFFRLGAAIECRVVNIFDGQISY